MILCHLPSTIFNILLSRDLRNGDTRKARSISDEAEVD